MTAVDPGHQPPMRLHRTGPFAWFFNPYAQIGIGAVLVAISELLLKKGAVAAPHLANVPAGLGGVAALASVWTWAGIVFYILSFASWIYVLRFVPLTVAFSLINLVHVLVPIGAWLVLGEQIPIRRWLGIVLILAGIIMVVGPATKAEEKL